MEYGGLVEPLLQADFDWEEVHLAIQVIKALAAKLNCQECEVLTKIHKLRQRLEDLITESEKLKAELKVLGCENMTLSEICYLYLKKIGVLDKNLNSPYD